MAFNQTIAKQLWEFAGYHCSSPTCRTRLAMPGGYGAIGEAAHIQGDKPGTARYNAHQPEVERQSFANGIFLCVACHRRADRAELVFTATLLHQWKDAANHDHLASIGMARRPQVHVDAADNHRRARRFIDRHRALAEATSELFLWCGSRTKCPVPDQLPSVLWGAEPLMDRFRPDRADYCFEPMTNAMEAELVHLVEFIRSSPALRITFSPPGEFDFRTRPDPDWGNVYLDPCVAALLTYLECFRKFEDYLALA